MSTIKQILGPEMQNDVRILAAQAMEPLQKQLEEQSAVIKALSERLAQLEAQHPPKSMHEMLTTPGGMAAMLGTPKK